MWSFKRKRYVGIWHGNSFVYDSGDIVMRILHSFVNNNSNRRICCSSIGIGIGNGNNIIRIMSVFATGILHTFGNDNINCLVFQLYWDWEWWREYYMGLVGYCKVLVTGIFFTLDSQCNMIGISNGNVIGYVWYMFGNI